MKMVRMPIQLPVHIKKKLDALRKQGTTASGFIRSLVEREFHRAPLTGRKGREARKGRNAWEPRS